jgi:hypothetical protein
MCRCVPHNTLRKIKASILLLGSLQSLSGLHPNHRTAASFLAALSGVCVALMLPSAHAATLTWAGGASNTWNSTSSWSPAQIPVNGDDLIFNTASANAQNNFANNALTLNSITFSASGQTLGQSSTNGILIGAGGVTVGNSLGNSQMVLPVTLNASQTWSLGRPSNQCSQLRKAHAQTAQRAEQAYQSRHMHEVHPDFRNKNREQPAEKNDRSKKGGNERRDALRTCGHIGSKSHRIKNDSKNNC